MMRRPRAVYPVPDDAGLTIVEVTVTLAICAAIFGIYASSVTDAVGFSAHSVGGASLHEIGRRALGRITADLSATGRFQDALGIEFPHVFSDGVPDPVLELEFEHDTAALAALVATFPAPPTPPQGGANPPPFVAPGFELTPFGIREIVFRRPRDLDGDGRIVSAATGQIEWEPGLFGYIVRPNAQASLDLVRRTVATNGLIRDEVICRCVEALTVDTVASKGTLPGNAVEIHLHLLRNDTQGRPQRLHLSTTIVMRNSP